MAVRGHQQAGREIAFASSKALRATAQLRPGDPARTAFEELVKELGISGAEVLRRAVLELHQRHKAHQAGAPEGGRIADTAA